jgi:hypothetical protein
MTLAHCDRDCVSMIVIGNVSEKLNGVIRIDGKCDGALGTAMAPRPRPPPAAGGLSH